MNDKTFDSPVFVADGPGLIREIATVGDAIGFLEEWPEDMQDTVYDTILRACYRAHDGQAQASTTRKAFETFARLTGILEENLPAVDPLVIPQKRGNSEVPL